MEPEKEVKPAQVYSREEYATKDFWESRYKENPGYFDWYAEFPELQQTFENLYNIKKDHSILNIGCGNSKLSDQMYEAGYQNQLNMDISPIVIEQMAKTSQEKGYDKMKWQVMDATDMKQVETGTFDIALDKGTLDALIAGKDYDICGKMLRQTMRVIKKDGQFILITHGSPQGRKKLFEAALGFDKYDYYVTKVDLNIMGTLINLMRSNLGNKPLNSIMKDKEALQKSMLEFNLIQMLRKKRKTEKKYVVWGEYKRKNVVFNEEQEAEEKKQETEAPKEPKEETTENQPQQKKTVYNPKKQCYCYVYSIQNKFAGTLEEQVPVQAGMNVEDYCKQQKIEIKDNKIVFEGPADLGNFGILYKNQSVGCELIRALVYLKKHGITNNPVTIYSRQEDYQSNKHKVKFVLEQGEDCYTPIYAKSVVQVKIARDKLPQCLNTLQSNLKSIATQLTEELNLHPSPFQYAFLGILYQKKSPGTHYYKSLNKYWYPTVSFNRHENDQVVYQLSLPPSADLQKSIDLIKKHMKYETEIESIRKGYLAYIEPKIFNILTLCSSLYGEQNQFPILVQQFIQETVPDFKNEGTIVLTKKLMAKCLARLFSAY